MATFRNTSDEVFVDGNITVLPNQQWTVMDPNRIEQLTNQYGWQFECLENDTPQAAQNAPSTPKQGKPLSKMNRAELEAAASQIGLEVTEAHDTNKKLKDAIDQLQQG